MKLLSKIKIVSLYVANFLVDTNAIVRHHRYLSGDRSVIISFHFNFSFNRIFNNIKVCVCRCHVGFRYSMDFSSSIFLYFIFKIYPYKIVLKLFDVKINLKSFELHPIEEPLKGTTYTETYFHVVYIYTFLSII